MHIKKQIWKFLTGLMFCLILLVGVGISLVPAQDGYSISEGFDNTQIDANGENIMSAILQIIREDPDYKPKSIRVVEIEGDKKIISRIPYSPDRHGKLEDQVSLVALGGILSLSFDKGTTLMANGETYNATIMPPHMVSFESEIPLGLEAVGDVYSLGPSDTKVYFDKPAVLQLPLPANADPDENWAVYAWDEREERWMMVADGGQVRQFSDQEAALLDEYGQWWIDQGGSFVIEVEIDHLTKFVVMRDRKDTDSVALGLDSAEMIERGLVSLHSSAIPNQLFDINLELDETKIEDINELNARVIFFSFGKIPTPVDLDFTILNSRGDVIHTVKDYIVVETEAALQKKFEGLDLAPGKYSLLVNTLYNIDVADEFRQDFEIKKTEFDLVDKLMWLAFGTVLGGAGAWLFLRARKKIS